MTPKIIELKQGPVVLVELEERPAKVQDSFANGFIYTDEKGYIESFYLDDICEDSKLVGILSDLTEEQFAEWVVRPFPPINADKKEKYRTAKQSSYSLLESENVYTENPYKHPREMKATPQSFGWYKDAVRAFEKAQSRTINPDRTVVLIRKEDK